MPLLHPLFFSPYLGCHDTADRSVEAAGDYRFCALSVAIRAKHRLLSAEREEERGVGIYTNF